VYKEVDISGLGLFGQWIVTMWLTRKHNENKKLPHNKGKKKTQHTICGHCTYRKGNHVLGRAAQHMGNKEAIHDLGKQQLILERILVWHF
jgi:hypothetical protein